MKKTIVVVVAGKGLGNGVAEKFHLRGNKKPWSMSLWTQIRGAGRSPVFIAAVDCGHPKVHTHRAHERKSGSSGL